MSLAPGNYLLTASEPTSGSYPVGAPKYVTVPPHKFVRVSLSLDTGLR